MQDSSIPTIPVENLGRAGAGIAEKIGYKQGYKDGVEAAIMEFNNWIDEDTIEAVRERLLND